MGQGAKIGKTNLIIFGLLLLASALRSSCGFFFLFLEKSQDRFVRLSNATYCRFLLFISRKKKAENRVADILSIILSQAEEQIL